MTGRIQRKHFRNEKGAISFEFLGILPFFFMFFLLLWQVVGTGYAIFTAKTAVNDAAKTFAATNDIYDSIEAAKETIGSSSVIKYKALVPQYSANGDFTLVLHTNHYLTFLPDKWKQEAAISIEQEAHGKVLLSP
ncbi:pilus assembly protein [Niallia oryzisoli]|uniref:pilus assembly protein n=1 Tax=Niallia oryzisoli TaxID=1737571 RepID=UPI003735B639